MRKRNTRKKDFGRHTQLSFTLGMIATGILFYLGIRHLNEAWGQFALLQCILCLIGTLGSTYVLFGTPIPSFKALKPETLTNAIYITIFSIVIQVVVSLPFQISDTERALYYIFVAVSEEMFFRAFILNIGVKYKVAPILNIFLSSLLFTGFHINYYADFEKLIGVFCGGLMLGFIYLEWNDITANIIGIIFL